MTVESQQSAPSPELREIIGQFNIADISRFELMMTELHRYLSEENEKYNLTRITGPEEFWIKHVLDSLYIVKYFPELAKSRYRMADIGAGAGFPSIVLSSAYQNLQFTAVESSHKKADFMRRASELLKLGNLRVETVRAREMAARKEWKLKFDIITARAVSTSMELYGETRPMLRQDGRFIFYKTPRQAETELCEIRKLSATHAGIKWDVTPSFSLPGNMGERLFIYSHR